jgi:hypothetical protein
MELEATIRDWRTSTQPVARKRPAELWRQADETPLAAQLAGGALGGLLATLPMTAMMLAIHRQLPRHERYRLEPQIVTEKTARRLGLGKHLDRRQRQALAAGAHLGFGAAAGAVFGPLAQRVPLVPVLSGVLYGLAVWAGSYAGWVPALGLLNPPDKRPKGRNAMMVAAHVVWGASLGLLVQLARRR